MSTERKFFWSFLWLGLALTGAAWVAQKIQIHVIVIRVEAPKPAPMRRFFTPLTCRPVPAIGGAGSFRASESNTAADLPAHAAGLQQIRSGSMPRSPEPGGEGSINVSDA